MKKNLLYILCLPILLGCLQACSPQSTGTVANTYHNATAHYNGYYLSKEIMKETEKEIFLKRKDNYNRVLHVMPPLDTNDLKGFNKKMEECIKTAAFAINRHPNSRWIDDCYVIVGKARFYLADYASAITTYKYVNGSATDEEARQRGLIELMKTYIIQDNMQDAEVVKNYLRKIGVEKENLASFYLMQAHFYRERRDYERTQKSIALALPLMEKGEPKARTYFLQGQLLQKLGDEKEAYKSYKRVLKNNPSYELRFYTELALLLTSDLKATSYRKIDKRFKKMLGDEKNLEYQDKIYYDMSTYELKRNRTAKAVERLKQSIDASTDNQAQKGYSYLRLGELHFEKLQEYELAKAYYDSTVMFLPKDEENYEKVAKRQKVLGSFVDYITTIQTEDSLQRMAKMSSSELNEMLDKSLTEQIKTRRALEKARLERKQAREKKLNRTGTIQEANRNQVGGGFYFSNSLLVEQGKLAFRKKWGNRPLTDNWRVASRVSQISLSTTTIEDPDAGLSPEEVEAKSIKKEVEKMKKTVLDKIPRDEKQIAASNKKIEDASYNLGKIYHFQLEEPNDASLTYKKLLARFPNTDYEPEVLYLLYLASKEMKKDSEVEKYKELEFSKYPKSVYTQLIKNPNFLEENKAKDKEAREQYAKAYSFYERKKYSLTIKKLNEIKQSYPNNTIQDKIDFLEILCIAKEGDLDSYKKQLNVFIQNYPKSELSENARQILKDLNNLPNP